MPPGERATKIHRFFSMTCCAITYPVPNMKAEVAWRKWSLKGADYCERLLRVRERNMNGRPT